MAISRVFFSDLKSGKCSGVVEARLLQFWEARNVKRGGELMWVDMLLVDVNVSSSFHVFRSVKRDLTTELQSQISIPPQHPRPTSQHRRQIPGPIQFHGGRKRRRRQRLELTGYSIDRRRWYRIEDVTEDLCFEYAITLKRMIRKGIPPVLRPKVWFSLSGAEKKKFTVPESYYSDLTKAVDGMVTPATRQIDHVSLGSV
ncbi:hypothetical protein IGI04_013316 [Brassica rapa subsp. trilocularis]|uniref:Rab-GAP TBC domain-containing protein n=1 Tax=Brassica rapa subsp. trilocularis TaxID=1813537 RepID=A0ABQ7N8H8_BRACM|nr:hypothetical protein IGI04_013316 [Brassica rapa subsp. trilocularis]